MKIFRRISILLLTVLMLLSLCACSSTKKNSSGSGSQTVGGYNSAYRYDDYAAEEAMPVPMPMADYDNSYGFSAVATTATAAGKDSGNNESETVPQTPDKIIYSSDVTVETTEFDETIGKISALVEEFGGWIESSSVSGSNYYQKSRGTAAARDASYTLRIPSSRFQELMDGLSGLGNVPYSHIYTENVTAQYYDTQAHLKAYQTQETRLLEMMEIAVTVEDVIIIEDRLTELRYQIESLQSRLNNWDRRVSYSTISLSVKEVKVYTPEEKVEPTYGEELLQALKDGLNNAGQFLKDLLVFLVEVLPVLLILVPVIWLVVWLLKILVRKIRTGMEKRKAKKRAAKKTVKAEAAAETPEEPGEKK